MYNPLLVFLDPVLRPVSRTRWLCLLLLVTLVAALLYLGSRPGIEVVIPSPPWDKLAHLVVFGGFAALGWVVLGARSYLGPVLIVAGIGLVDETLQHFSPGRTADAGDIAADLVGAIIAMLILAALRSQSLRRFPGGVLPASR